jgi:hypothetical protein
VLGFFVVREEKLMDLSIGFVFFGLVIAIFLSMAFLSLLFKIKAGVKWLLGYEAVLDIIFSLSIFGLVGSTTGLFVVAFAAVMFTVLISIAHEAYGDKTLRFNGMEAVSDWLNGEDEVVVFETVETPGVGLPQAVRAFVGRTATFIWRVVSWKS